MKNFWGNKIWEKAAMYNRALTDHTSCTLIFSDKDHSTFFFSNLNNKANRPGLQNTCLCSWKLLLIAYLLVSALHCCYYIAERQSRAKQSKAVVRGTKRTSVVSCQLPSRRRAVKNFVTPTCLSWTILIFTIPIRGFYFLLTLCIKIVWQIQILRQRQG